MRTLDIGFRIVEVDGEATVKIRIGDGMLSMEEVIAPHRWDALVADVNRVNKDLESAKRACKWNQLPLATD